MAKAEYGEHDYIVTAAHVVSSNPQNRETRLRGQTINLAHLLPEQRDLLISRKVVAKPASQDAKDALAYYQARTATPDEPTTTEG